MRCLSRVDIISLYVVEWHICKSAFGIHIGKPGEQVCSQKLPDFIFVILLAYKHFRNDNDVYRRRKVILKAAFKKREETYFDYRYYL